MIHRPALGDTRQLDARSYVTLRGYSLSLAERLVELLRLTQDSVLLDVGCGPGKHTALVNSLTACRVVGCDLSGDRLQDAARNFSQLDWVSADAHQLPFSSDSFSAAQAVISFHRFADRLAALRDIHRVLVPGGAFAVVSPTPAQLSRRIDLCSFPTALEVERRRFPTLETTTQQLTDSGFVRVRSLDFVERGPLIDVDWLRWIEAYPYTSLRELSRSEFELGLQELRQLVREQRHIQTVLNELTVVVGQKPC